ncbi:MAG TPA: alpha/beta hydrolase [Sphingopyxis sp.]|uniref:alpha/beta hydrolase n=1 Tax=Sphingopyxis sp. TaxID=1908224 RepID=UPI002CAAEF2C|nr:alpha/beta hydrolase [Sphingopyxis sp.]HWW55530.1 alpha/beta hydrolase [Sphingopyxis sp.]
MTISKQSAASAARPAPPSAWLAAAELPRAVSEMTLLAASVAGLLHSAPRGDGHPVLVLPGLLAGDRSTAALRGILGKLGYDARPWGLGRNRGPHAIGTHGELLEARVEALFEEAGKKVSLVGWSLGGVFARLLARRLPGRIRQVITLGSPFMDSGDATNAGKIFEIASGTKRNDSANRALLAELSGPSRVPSSAIYSRSDGICAWQICREDAAERRESIEVYGSHCGLGVNPSVIYAVADRLAQAEDAWAPFEPRGLTSWAFPTAVNA